MEIAQFPPVLCGNCVLACVCVRAWRENKRGREKEMSSGLRYIQTQILCVDNENIKTW